MKHIQQFLIIIVLLIQTTGYAAVTATNTADFAAGADVSWLTQMEASGKKFYNASGTQTECMALLKSLGMNSIRLRVWVNPADGWCNAQDVLAKAIRANNLGMRIMIVFHYSDTWADPAAQTKPAAWTSLTFANLKTAVATHTTEVLNLLKTNGITPEWVQVGNETGNGMLWEDGKASTSMTNYAALTTAGYDAVKAVCPNAKVIVHINNGFSNSLFRWIFDGLKTYGAKYDVIGMSLYPAWYTTANDWQNCNIACLANMNDMVSRYGKEVMIVESGMSWDSPAACKSFLTDIIAKTKTVTGGKGLGVFYWEPESYGNWSGYTLGAFDNTGKPTIALNAFNQQTSIQPVENPELTFSQDRTNGYISFNHPVINISITDISGKVKIIKNSGKLIETNRMPKGIYIITATQQNTNKKFRFKFRID